MTKTEQVTYKNFGKCIRIFNDTTEVLVTTDIGPRVIRYALIGKENIFCEHYTEEAYNNETGWKIYGGHRLWHSPEDDPRTYSPDNDPVNFEILDNGAYVANEIEPMSGLLKEMTITLADEGSDVFIMHNITNKNYWPIEFAAWSISVMAEGGKEVIPMTQKDTGLLHNRSISLWSYTKMNDERVYWGEKYITLQQNPDCGDENFKIGINNDLEWAAYFNNNQAFVKRFINFKDEKYPDNGMSYETYTCNYMVEMETLSPLDKIESNESINHVELWSITDDVSMPSNDEESIDTAVSLINIPGPDTPEGWFGSGCEDEECDCNDNDECCCTEDDCCDCIVDDCCCDDNDNSDSDCDEGDCCDCNEDEDDGWKEGCDCSKK